MTTDTYPSTIHEFLTHIARYDSKQALVTHGEDNALSYKELVDKILQVGLILKDHKGLVAGDRIMLYGLSGPDWVVTFFACLLNGYIAVPIDARMSPELANDILRHTKPGLIICKDKISLKTKINSVLFSQLTKTKVLSSDLRSFDQVDGNTIAEIILTSGTWAQPRGVTLTHKNLLSNLAGIDSAYRPAKGAKWLSILPLSHAYGQMMGLFMPLFRGTTITYITEIHTEILTSAIDEHGISLIVAVPRILELLRKGILKQVPRSRQSAFENIVIQSRWLPVSVRRRIFAKVHKSLGVSLKTFMCGGSPLEQKLDYFFQGLGYTVLVGYGLSETAPVLSVSLDQKRSAGNVGLPLSNVSIELSDDGEVLAKGDNVFYGYWPKRRKQQPFNTGDLGQFDNKGNLILIGRRNNLVVFSSGDKIFLEDVEKIADGLEGIEESCALNLSNDSSPHIHLFVVTEHKDLAHFQGNINAKLPLSVQIKSISRARTAALPRTHTLKLNRKQIIDYHAQDIEKLTARSS